MKKVCVFTWRKNEFKVSVSPKNNGYIGYFITDKISGEKTTYRVGCILKSKICRIYLGNGVDHLHECECSIIDEIDDNILSLFKEEGNYIQTNYNAFVRILKVSGDNIILDRYIINENEIFQKTMFILFRDMQRYIPKEFYDNIHKLTLDDVFMLISNKDIVKDF